MMNYLSLQPQKMPLLPDDDKLTNPKRLPTPTCTILDTESEDHISQPSAHLYLFT